MSRDMMAALNEKPSDLQPANKGPPEMRSKILRHFECKNGYLAFSHFLSYLVNTFLASQVFMWSVRVKTSLPSSL